jgi:Bacterial SH3 domain
MKKLLLIASLIASGAVSGGFVLKDDSAPVVGEGCRVADTTGTPLNVRVAPKRGGILGALANGTVVKVLELRDEWVRIKPHNAPGATGWVYLKYLDCRERP